MLAEMKRRFNERVNDPHYYETVQCEECGSTENLLLHYYAETFACLRCVDEKIEALEEQKRIDEENEEYEESEALTLEQRNK